VTAGELRAILKQLGFTQVGLAAYFGAGERTVRRWCSDGKDAVPVPVEVSLLLRYIAVIGDTPEAARLKANKWRPAA
jgi:DNA-binding transcriptional regulator YiaG